jgi:hypothetical protein
MARKAFAHQVQQEKGYSSHDPKAERDQAALASVSPVSLFGLGFPLIH